MIITKKVQRMAIQETMGDYFIIDDRKITKIICSIKFIISNWMMMCLSII